LDERGELDKRGNWMWGELDEGELDEGELVKRENWMKGGRGDGRRRRDKKLQTT